MNRIDSADHNAHVLTYRQRVAAIKKLAEDNLRLVDFMVTKWVKKTGRPDLREEAISQGNVSLMKAAKLFDETRGYKFTTYACRAIEQNLWRLINDLSKGIRIGKRKRVHISHNDDGDERDPLKMMVDYDYEAEDKSDVFDQVHDMIRFLDERRRKVITMRFLGGNTSEATSFVMGVSKIRVIKMQQEAFAIMRRAAKRKQSMGAV